MFLDKIRRCAAWAGLAGAFAFIMPTSTALAYSSATPTPLTVTPTLGGTIPAAQNGGAASAGAGLIEVAQNRRAQRLRRLRGRVAQRNRRAGRRAVRRGRPGWRRGARRFRHNGRWYWYNRGRYYDDTGAAVAAGIIGLAAGAIAGAAIADAREPDVVVIDEPGLPRPFSGEWYRRCAEKYRSFRVSDGTFLGFDGVRRRCRLP